MSLYIILTILCSCVSVAHGQLKSVLISTISTVLYNVFSLKIFMLKLKNLLT